MAAVVKCECCGKVLCYKDALHIRVHKLGSATTFMNNPESYADVCKGCGEQIMKLMKQAEDKNDK